jgi:hypothetical protein
MQGRGSGSALSASALALTCKGIESSGALIESATAAA